MYYLSIDGGGSKTAFLITDESGNTIAEKETVGCAYPQIGIQGTEDVISQTLRRLLEEKGIPTAEIKGAAVGIPCLGENPEADKILRSAVEEIFAFCRPYICNDVELGWAGSLGMDAGIHMVAGTGAIAFGRDGRNHSARANGWHEDFSDEGSGYWLGLQTLSLFAKQLDGRMEKSVLYRKMCKQLGTDDLRELVPLYVEEYQGNRKKIASLQEILYHSAQEGDGNAADIYRRAASELADSIRAVASKLEFGRQEPIPVSYSGGIFRTGDCILGPLQEILGNGTFILREPLLNPVQGGILLAAACKAPECAERIKGVLVTGRT